MAAAEDERKGIRRYHQVIMNIEEEGAKYAAMDKKGILEEHCLTEYENELNLEDTRLDKGINAFFLFANQINLRLQPVSQIYPIAWESEVVSAVNSILSHVPHGFFWPSSSRKFARLSQPPFAQNMRNLCVLGNTFDPVRIFSEGLMDRLLHLSKCLKKRHEACHPQNHFATDSFGYTPLENIYVQNMEPFLETDVSVATALRCVMASAPIREITDIFKGEVLVREVGTILFQTDKDYEPRERTHEVHTDRINNAFTVRGLSADPNAESKEPELPNLMHWNSCIATVLISPELQSENHTINHFACTGLPGPIQREIIRRCNLDVTSQVAPGRRMQIACGRGHVQVHTNSELHCVATSSGAVNRTVFYVELVLLYNHQRWEGNEHVSTLPNRFVCPPKGERGSPANYRNLHTKEEGQWKPIKTRKAWYKWQVQHRQSLGDLSRYAGMRHQDMLVFAIEEMAIKKGIEYMEVHTKVPEGVEGTDEEEEDVEEEEESEEDDVERKRRNHPKAERSSDEEDDMLDID